MSNDFVNRESIINNVSEYQNKHIPKLTNKTNVSTLLHNHFNRVGSELPDLVDVLLYSIIDGICGHMEMTGIRQPTAKDFLNAFKTVNGIYINVGSLTFSTSTMTSEMYESIKAELKSDILKDLRKHIKSEIGSNDEFEYDEKAANDELDEAFDKYNGLMEEEEDGKESEG